MFQIEHYLRSKIRGRGRSGPKSTGALFGQQSNHFPLAQFASYADWKPITRYHATVPRSGSARPGKGGQPQRSTSAQATQATQLADAELRTQLVLPEAVCSEPYSADHIGNEGAYLYLPKRANLVLRVPALSTTCSICGPHPSSSDHTAGKLSLRLDEQIEGVLSLVGQSGCLSCPRSRGHGVKLQSPASRSPWG